MTDWAEVYRGLRVLDTPTPPIGPPSAADLDRFEREFGFRLPIDYRAFIRVFGPGQLTSDFSFRSAGCSVNTLGPAADQFNAGVDLAAFNRMLREMMTTRDAMDGPYTPQARRLGYFADNTAGDCVGWDPLDVRDETASEYGVYEVRREDGGAQPRAARFAEFVERDCLDDAARPDYWSFQPAWRYFEPTG